MLDPGHGVEPAPDGPPPDTATDDVEQALTLALARRIAQHLGDAAGRAHAARLGKRIAVFLTRWDDSAPSQDARAAVAARYRARLFLSLHFNRGGERGTEAWIDRKHSGPHHVVRHGQVVAVEDGPGQLSSPFRNLNHVDDAAFAAAVAAAACAPIQAVDADAALRSTLYDRAAHGQDYRPPPGVKMKALDLLRDTALGPPGGACRACVLQIEFLDHPRVRALFTGPGGQALLAALAQSLARRLIDLV